MMARQHNAPQPSLLALAGAALLYMVLAETTATPLPGQGPEQLLQPASGLALVLLVVCGVGAGAGAVVESTGGVLAGAIAPSAWTAHVLHWWLSCALGSLLIAPVAMSYRRTLRFAEPLRRMNEGILVWVLTMVCAIAIFGNTQIPLLAPLANVYWMFLFVSWSGARVGLLSTTGLLCMIALQALWGTYQRTGFFAHDIATSHGFGYWSFMMILAVVGLSLAAHIAELRRQKAALRVAAIAFEARRACSSPTNTP